MVRAKEKDAIVTKELKEEFEHPEHIMEDILKNDEKNNLTTKDFEPKGIDAKSSKLLLYVALFIILLFTFFLGGKFIFEKFMVNPQNDLQFHNGFSFSQDPETKIWFTTYKMGSIIYPMQFRYHPTEVQDGKLLFDTTKLVTNREGILQSLPPTNTSQYSIAAIEFVSKVTNTFRIYSKAGVFAKTEDVSDEVPIITCDDASDSIAVIVYQKGDTTQAYELFDNCYVVEGPTYTDVIKMIDKVIYSILGML
jgi:hypothetical protein